MNTRIELQRYRREKLRQLSQRAASGRYQSQAERDREEAENRKYGAVGAAAGVAGIVGARSAASRIGSLGPDAIKRVADTIKRVPLPGRRILTGGALAQALRNIR